MINSKEFVSQSPEKHFFSPGEPLNVKIINRQQYKGSDGNDSFNNELLKNRIDPEVDSPEIADNNSRIDNLIRSLN